MTEFLDYLRYMYRGKKLILFSSYKSMTFRQAMIEAAWNLAEKRKQLNKDAFNSISRKKLPQVSPKHNMGIDMSKGKTLAQLHQEYLDHVLEAREEYSNEYVDLVREQNFYSIFKK